MLLDLPRGPSVKLEPYSPAWADEYQRERERIVAAVGDRIQGIEHVGSTAIPGVCAKPIIDIAIAVPTLDTADTFAPALAKLGYDYPGDIGIPGERIFGRGSVVRTHIIHVVAAGGTEWRHYVEFRDALRTNPLLAAEYDRLKIRLAHEHTDDCAAYTRAKSEFIDRVLRLANPDRVRYRLAPAGPSDQQWLDRLRRRVYEDLVMDVLGEWDEVKHQRHCAECWARGEIALIEVGGVRVGMVQLLERPDAIEIGEIEILPEHQNRGIGSQILRDTIARADAQRRHVVLSVGLENERARRLFERLGFREVSRSETHCHMAHHALR